MAKVESRCVLVPSSSVSLACIVGYLSSNRERERDGKSPSLFQTANVMTFFSLPPHPWKRKLCTGLLLAGRRP